MFINVKVYDVIDIRVTERLVTVAIKYPWPTPRNRGFSKYLWLFSNIHGCTVPWLTFCNVFVVDLS